MKWMASLSISVMKSGNALSFASILRQAQTPKRAFSDIRLNRLVPVCWDHTHGKETLMKRILLLFAVVIVTSVAVGRGQVTGNGLVLLVAQAQLPGTKRTDLQRHDLSITGREVVQTIVELAPGTTAPRHTHPGEEIIYVIEGTWEYTVEGKPPLTLKAGEVLFIPAGTVHSARNIGTGRAAELATYIVEKGKPLVVLGE